MIITRETIEQINTRFQWDDIIDSPHVSVPITADGLRLVMRSLSSRADLIVVCWSAGEALLDESNRLFNESEHGEHTGLQTGRFNLSVMHLGYIGAVDNIPVVASIHLDRHNQNFALATSADRPFSIEGSNSLWVSRDVS